MTFQSLMVRKRQALASVEGDDETLIFPFNYGLILEVNINRFG